jgi:hypothetical protein
MWTAILSLVGTLLTFLVKLGTEWLDGNKERQKERKVVKDEIKKATSQRDRIMAINRYNRI